MVDQKAPGIPGQLGWECLQSGGQVARLLVGISKLWCMLPKVTDNLGKNK